MSNECENDSQELFGAYDYKGKQCGLGNGSCGIGRLLTAYRSDFHDQAMIDATIAINEILDKIPADRQGRKLSLLNLKIGCLLAWMEHSEIVPAEGATIHDDIATIAREFGLDLGKGQAQ